MFPYSTDILRLKLFEIFFFDIFHYQNSFFSNIQFFEISSIRDFVFLLVLISIEREEQQCH
jgi:hypothetical protein